MTNTKQPIILTLSYFSHQNNKVEALRIPLNQDTAPDFGCFDQVLALLKDTTASTPIVFNCQAGISRTTTAMVIAALIKEFQLSSELNQMKGIVPDDILEALKKKKLGLPGIDTEVRIRIVLLVSVLYRYHIPSGPSGEECAD